MKIPASLSLRFVLSIWIWATSAFGADLRALVTEANVATEMTFLSGRTYADPFNEVSLDVLFTGPNGQERRVPAFWAGNNVWKVRYASPVTGMHRFRSVCSERQDQGLHGVSGTVEIKNYTGSNPLLLHGPLRVDESHRYLQHLDQTPFLWLGDTWWMGLCHRLQWPEEFKTLAADRKGKGFNVIQIVAGLYPDMPPFDPRGANENGFPWETNYARIRPQYFDAADQRLGYLVEQGLMPCVVGAWGYFMPWMGVERMKAHWRYLIARYSAWPVVWCAAGEANLPWYLASGFPYDDRKQLSDWTEILRFIRATDPFHRPLTIHPTAIKRYTARHATDDAELLAGKQAIGQADAHHEELSGLAFAVGAAGDAFTVALGVDAPPAEVCVPVGRHGVAAEASELTDLVPRVPGVLGGFEALALLGLGLFDSGSLCLGRHDGILWMWICGKNKNPTRG